jgi:hypothetical protein
MAKTRRGFVRSMTSPVGNADAHRISIHYHVRDMYARCRFVRRTFLQVSASESGAPDRIRTCDLCLRRDEITTIIKRFLSVA